MSYDELCRSIIRPPKEIYKTEDLGDDCFTMSGNEYVRTDFVITSVQGHIIQASHYEPIENSRISPIMPCVIFLHGNSSSRLEARNSLFLLTGYMTVVCFDFSGCGLSEGEYISLGWFEHYDVANLIDYLREERRVGKVALWGRSMGAVTALMYSCQNPKSIECMVLDSPFSDLKGVVLHLARQNASYVPEFLVKFLLGFVRKSIKSRAGFDIYKLKPINYLANSRIPAIFAYGTKDELIPITQFDDLYKSYKGNKELILFQNAGHNDIRPLSFCKQAGSFFCENLKVETLGRSPIQIPPHLITGDVIKKAKEIEHKNEFDMNRTGTVRFAADKYYQTIPRLGN